MTTPNPFNAAPVIAPGGGAPWWVVSSSATANIGLKVVQASVMPSLTIGGPYSTRALAEAGLAAFQKAPTGTIPGVVAGSLVPGAITSWGQALGSIASTFSRLEKANFWERAGMVLLGIVLISAGVAHLTHAVPIATKIAKTAAAVV